MAAHRALKTLLAAILVAAPASALADKGGKDKEHPRVPPGQSAGKGSRGKPEKSVTGEKGDRPGDYAGRVLITSGERRLIEDYFRSNPSPAQGLPPGIARNLARGKPLPPGIAKRYLPPSLIGQLPRRPGYEWVAVGRDVALIAVATGIVVDILSDVF